MKSQLLERQTILFLHGFLSEGCIWNDLPVLLPPQNQYIIPDLKGHNRRHNETNNDYITQSALDFLAHINQPITVIGHSLGGYIGLKMLELDESKINRLILINSTIAADSAEKKKERKKACIAFTKNKSLFIKLVIDGFLDKTNKTHADLLKESAAKVTSEDMIHISESMMNRNAFLPKQINYKKVFWIHSTLDRTIPYGDAIQLAHEFGISFKTLTDCGHYSFIQKPEACAKLIIEILNVK